MHSVTSTSTRPAARLLFVRHGATAPNLAGLRCGGDLDPPLVEQGRRQALQLARLVAAHPRPIELIICSDLQRTRETAAIVRAALGPVELRVMPAFRERRLGGWNLQPIADTETLLAAGQTPPGGESSADFKARITQAMTLIAPALERRVLLVASKGVGRVLRELAGLPVGKPLGNAELLELTFESTLHPDPTVSTA